MDDCEHGTQQGGPGWHGGDDVLPPLDDIFDDHQPPLWGRIPTKNGIEGTLNWLKNENLVLLLMKIP